MRERSVVPAQVLAEAATADPMELMRLGIDAARAERYARGLVLLAEAYKLFSQETEVLSEDVKTVRGIEQLGPRKRTPAICFSYYGLCLALTTSSQTEEGARFCEVAIQLEPQRGEHYLNLAKIWQAARLRSMMVAAVERGLKESPRSAILLAFQDEIGVRSVPPISFLERDNPLNKELGKILHTRRRAKAAPKLGVRRPATDAAPPPDKPKR
ncbi:MAG TPA: hypothetical protein VF554_12090 [Thermoanaerobaculia bacterium]|jgi:hypothetical protein